MNRSVGVRASYLCHMTSLSVYFIFTYTTHLLASLYLTRLAEEVGVDPNTIPGTN